MLPPTNSTPARPGRMRQSATGCRQRDFDPDRKAIIWSMPGIATRRSQQCHHNTRESAIPVAQIGGRISEQTTNRVIARVRWFLLPSDPIPREDRVGWLDGMRGIAAVQVVLLHYATAFLPGLGLHDRAMMHHRWERIIADTPLFFVLNGCGSVYLFFLLSGVVLTYSFARRPFVAVQWTLRRIIRLGLPMRGAILLGGILISTWPSAHIKAAQLTGLSSWLGAVSPRAATAAMAIHQMMLEGMAAGYRETSVLPGWAIRQLGLDSLYNAFDEPLWTLHYEFIGSLLIIVLVMLRAAVPRGVHLAGCIGLGVALAVTPLVMFVVGHLAAPALARGPRPRG
jgi:peptidoglycan/LPS O-acetylase OafA/YrhL